MQRDPPVWKSAANNSINSSELYLYNSFTRQKVRLINRIY